MDNIYRVNPAKQDVRETIHEDTSSYGSAQVSYRNPEAVEPYLASHPEIEAFLSESWPGLEKHFGKNVSLILEVMTCPGEESYDELVGWIQSTDEIEVGLDKLEVFEEEWLEKELRKVGNGFNFDIEFK
jgi:hypothetical protein